MRRGGCTGASSNSDSGESAGSSAGSVVVVTRAAGPGLGRRFNPGNEWFGPASSAGSDWPAAIDDSMSSRSVSASARLSKLSRERAGAWCEAFRTGAG